MPPACRRARGGASIEVTKERAKEASAMRRQRRKQATERQHPRDYLVARGEGEELAPHAAYYLQRASELTEEMVAPAGQPSAELLAGAPRDAACLRALPALLPLRENARGMSLRTLGAQINNCRIQRRVPRAADEELQGLIDPDFASADG